MKTLGIILIILGVLALVYQGVQYTTKDKTDLGLFTITTSNKKNIPLPPIVGGVALIAGIALVLADRRKK